MPSGGRGGGVRILPPFVHSFQYSWSICKPVLQILFWTGYNFCLVPSLIDEIVNSKHMRILCPYESQDFAFPETYPEGWSHSAGQRSVQMERREETRLFLENDGQDMVDWIDTVNNSQFITVVFYVYHSWLVLVPTKFTNLQSTVRPCTGAWYTEKRGKAFQPT